MLNSIKKFFKGTAKTAISLPGAIGLGLTKTLSVPFEMASNILKGSVGNLVHKVSKTLVETFKTAKETYKTITSKNWNSLVKYPAALFSTLAMIPLGGTAHGLNNTLGFGADSIKSTIALSQAPYRHSLDTLNALQGALTMATDPNKQTTASYYSGIVKDTSNTLKKNYFSDLGMKSIGIASVDKFFGLEGGSTHTIEEKKEGSIVEPEDGKTEKNNEEKESSKEEKKKTKELEELTSRQNDDIKNLNKKLEDLTTSLQQQQDQIKKAEEKADSVTNSTPTQSKESKEAIDALHEQIKTSTESMKTMEESLKEASEKAEQTLQAIQSGQQVTDDIKTTTDTLTQTIQDLQSKLDQQKTDLESQISAVENKIPVPTP